MGVMRVNTSKLIYQPRIDEFEQRSFHKHMFFFDPNWDSRTEERIALDESNGKAGPPLLMQRPEFIHKNQLVELKESEIAVLLKDLTDAEEALKANRAELSTAGGAPGTGKPATGKDAKKDAKAGGKPAAKGAAPVEDKNAPKPIEIEYPEDV